MKSYNSFKVIIFLYLVASAFWVALMVIFRYSLVSQPSVDFLKLLTQIPLAVIPIVGGILGLKNSMAWGGFKSIIGRCSLFLSLGLIAWGGGMVVWNYYIFFTDYQIPYPSLADAGYVLGLLFFVVGIWALSDVVGAKFALRSKEGILALVMIPVVIFLLSMYLLIYVARGGVLTDTSGGYVKLFFDILYPLGDVVILTMVSLIYILSRNLLGGRYKVPVLTLFVGFLIFYISDFSFSYTTTIGAYYNGYFPDFLFTTAMFVLSLGMTGFVLPTGEKRIDTAGLGITKEATVYNEMVLKVIRRQELIMGRVAWDEAKNIAGLNIDSSHDVVSFYGDQKDIVNRLVARYEKLFGKTARIVCRDAVLGLLATMSSEQIPTSLK